jgi:hypothetical protein
VTGCRARHEQECTKAGCRRIAWKQGTRPCFLCCCSSALPTFLAPLQAPQPLPEPLSVRRRVLIPPQNAKNGHLRDRVAVFHLSLTSPNPESPMKRSRRVQLWRCASDLSPIKASPGTCESKTSLTPATPPSQGIYPVTPPCLLPAQIRSDFIVHTALRRECRHLSPFCTKTSPCRVILLTASSPHATASALRSPPGNP